MFLARRITKEPSIESHGLITGLQLIRTPVHRTAAVMFIDDGLTREYAELWHHIMCFFIHIITVLSTITRIRRVRKLRPAPRMLTNHSHSQARLQSFLLWSFKFSQAVLNIIHRLWASYDCLPEKISNRVPPTLSSAPRFTRTVASWSSFTINISTSVWCTGSAMQHGWTLGSRRQLRNLDRSHIPLSDQTVMNLPENMHQPVPLTWLHSLEQRFNNQQQLRRRRAHLTRTSLLAQYADINPLRTLARQHSKQSVLPTQYEPFLLGTRASHSSYICFAA